MEMLKNYGVKRPPKPALAILKWVNLHCNGFSNCSQGCKYAGLDMKCRILTETRLKEYGQYARCCPSKWNIDLMELKYLFDDTVSLEEVRTALDELTKQELQIYHILRFRMRE